MIPECPNKGKNVCFEEMQSLKEEEIQIINSHMAEVRSQVSVLEF